jgi:hypothetical protein
MTTRTQTHGDVLHATDTALRLVNQALGDLGTADDFALIAEPVSQWRAERSDGILSLASTLLRASGEVASLLDRIRRSRRLLRRAADAPPDRPGATPGADTSTAESAARGMRAGLGRAIAMVRRLEEDAAGTQDLARLSRFSALREELDGVLTRVPVGRVRNRQLDHAAAVINHTERRLVQLVQRFDPFVADAPSDPR